MENITVGLLIKRDRTQRGEGDHFPLQGGSVMDYALAIPYFLLQHCRGVMFFEKLEQYISGHFAAEKEENIMISNYLQY